MDQRDSRTYAVIGAAMEVHKELGNGFLEKVYQEALACELSIRSIPHEREVSLPTYYKGTRLKADYRADFVCYCDVIVEIKAIRTLTDADSGQVVNYLRAAAKPVGLLLNFGSPSLQYKRFVASSAKSA